MKQQILERQLEFPEIEEARIRKQEVLEEGVCLIASLTGIALGVYLTCMPQEHYETFVNYLKNIF